MALDTVSMTDPNTQAETIHPFTISIPEKQLDDLHRRLSGTISPPPIDAEAGVEPARDWSIGTPPAYLRELVEYWRDDYDWRAVESELNAIPQFTTVIDGQVVHFLHLHSPAPDARPLLLTHGWPGSFIEFLDLIEPLTSPPDTSTPAFHLVIPTIPGFGFSTPLTGRNWSESRIAGTWLTLMSRLGYEQFGVHGGDLGAGISPEVARLAPDRVIGVHVNGGPGPMPVLPLSDDQRDQLDERDLDRVARIEHFMQNEFGYIAIQSTRPQTLAAGLVDSPSGLLSWIIDKFREWTWPREAEPDEVIGRDRLLTNVMLYWLTQSAGTAAFVGYAQPQGWGKVKANSGVPTAAIVFAHDVGIRRFAETENDIVRWTDVDDRGGHFAAMEEPELLVADIRAFFGGR